MIKTAWGRAILGLNYEQAQDEQKTAIAFFLSPVEIEQAEVSDYYKSIWHNNNYVHQDLSKTATSFKLWRYSRPIGFVELRVIT